MRGLEDFRQKSWNGLRFAQRRGRSGVGPEDNIHGA